MAQWLVKECGANVNMVDQYGWSPLMHTCADQKLSEVELLSMVQWLVTEARANVHVTSTEAVDGYPVGATARDIATISGNHAVIERVNHLPR